MWAAGVVVSGLCCGVAATARAAVPLGLCLGWTVWSVWNGVTNGLLFDLWNSWGDAMRLALPPTPPLPSTASAPHPVPLPLNACL